MSHEEHDDDDVPAGDDYLWDRSGPVDARVAELEELLGTLRYERSMPAVEAPVPRKRPSQLYWLAVAAGVALVCWAWLSREGAELAPPVARLHLPEVTVPTEAADPAPAATVPKSRQGWPVEVVEGAPELEGQPVAKQATLHVGAWIETDERSRARVAVADIGTLDVEPGSRLRLVGTAANEHEVELTRGKVRATVDAPPRVFLVQTPSTTAVDLGCSYQLEVMADGSTILNVRTGWVALESRHNPDPGPDSTMVLPAYVPAGTRCRADAQGNPGLPVRVDAPAAFLAAVERFEGGQADAAAELIAQAVSGDEVTLWHLYARVPEAGRDAVYQKLAEIGRPAEDRGAVLAGDTAAHETWGRALGVVPPLGWPEEGPPDRPKPTWDPEQWSAPSGGPPPDPLPNDRERGRGNPGGVDGEQGKRDPGDTGDGTRTGGKGKKGQGDGAGKGDGKGNGDGKGKGDGKDAP